MDMQTATAARPVDPVGHAITPMIPQMQCMEIWGGNRPAESAVTLHGLDAWVLSEPHGGDAAGGDIHYVSMCGGGQITRIVLADVAGHGAVVDGLAGRLRGLMRKYINRYNQTAMARAMNREFTGLAEGGRFATAILSTYLAKGDEFITCNAGHPAPLWYRAELRVWQKLEPNAPGTQEQVTNLPLGIVEPTDYHQFAVRLGRGDLVLLYTDSLIDAHDAAGESLGEDGLCRLVGTLDVSRPELLCRAIRDAVIAYQQGRPLADDATLMVLRHNAANPPRQSLGEILRVLAKMFRLIPV